MLNSIGEIGVTTTTRVETHQTVEDRDIALQKAEKVVEERPIETDHKAATAESNTGQETDGYNLDDGSIFFEKYDKNGNVIIRVPQEQKPIDELA